MASDLTWDRQIHGKVLLNFVAGLMSHSSLDISTWMLHSFNIKENEIRIAEWNELERKKNGDKARKETEGYKRKQIASDFARKQRVAKDSTKKERHIPDKISLVKGSEAECHSIHLPFLPPFSQASTIA
jgi:hypothetical protein